MDLLSRYRFGPMTDRTQAGMMNQNVTAYAPTLRDMMSTWLLGDNRPSPEQVRLVEGITGSRGMGTTGMGLIDMTPAGIPFGVQDGYREGDATKMAMAILPGAPKSVAGSARAANAAAGEVRQGIRAFHGSPHDFDRFDSEAPAWFSMNEGVAREFGKDRMGVDGPGSSYYNATAWREAKPNMYEVRINGKLMDVDPTQDAVNIAKQIGVDPPTDWADISQILRWGDAQKDWIYEARTKGFDGVRFKNVGDAPSGTDSDHIAIINHSVIDIVKKYGIAGAAALVGWDAVNKATGSQKKSNDLMGEIY